MKSSASELGLSNSAPLLRGLNKDHSIVTCTVDLQNHTEPFSVSRQCRAATTRLTGSTNAALQREKMHAYFLRFTA